MKQLGTVDGVLLPDKDGVKDSNTLRPDDISTLRLPLGTKEGVNDGLLLGTDDGSLDWTPLGTADGVLLANKDDGKD